jgi:hypothetical protein
MILLIRISKELDPIVQKRIGDEQWFYLFHDGSHCLRKRAQSCWERNSEWFTRIFTNKMPQLRNKFEAIVTDFESYLAEETDETRRGETIGKYSHVINEIFRTAERLRVAKVSGFLNAEQAPVLTKGPQIVKYIACPAAYQIQAHLPQWLYTSCRDKGLLPSSEEGIEQTTEQSDGTALLHINLDAADRKGVVLSYKALPNQQFYSVLFQHRTILGYSALDHDDDNPFVRHLPPFLGIKSLNSTCRYENALRVFCLIFGSP